MKHLLAFTGVTLLLACSQAMAAPAILRIGIQDDPDMLDPHRSRTYAGRLVYTALCDKLVETDADLQFIPRLATAWEWSEDGKMLTMNLREGVTFHDGEPFDAEAVKFNLDRARTLPDSQRKSELSSVESVEATAPSIVTIHLKKPDATLIAQLSDRSGMMLAPKAAAGADYASKPVCSGPYEFVERVQQDRIVLKKYDGYWNKDVFHFDRVVFMPIPDTSVRLANLRSGDLDMIERVAPTDVKSAKADTKLKVYSTPGLGFMEMVVNIDNGPKAQNPLGQDKRVRQAFELSLDRDAINQVVFEGLYIPANQALSPSSPFFDKTKTIPARDPEKARALLGEAGVNMPFPIDLKVANNPIAQQIGQIIQAMAQESGFQVNLIAGEYATQLSEQQAGNYQVALYNWSGRPDPDGNLHQFVTCNAPLNDARYCNPKVDELLNEARVRNDLEERKALYAQAQEILIDEAPYIYLFFDPRLFVARGDLQNFQPQPDGLIRLENVSLAP